MKHEQDSLVLFPLNILNSHIVRIDKSRLKRIPDDPAQSIPGKGDAGHQSVVAWKPLLDTDHDCI